jgi:ABC-type amino acid transport system permease subunit
MTERLIVMRAIPPSTAAAPTRAYVPESANVPVVVVVVILYYY